MLSTEEIFKNLLGVPEEEFGDGNEKTGDLSDKAEGNFVKEEAHSRNQTDTGSDVNVCAGTDENADLTEGKKDTD